MTFDKTGVGRRRCLWWRVAAAAAIGLGVLVVVAVAVYDVWEVGGGSMEPVLHGRGNPPAGAGDFVLVQRLFSRKSLRKGDLVLVRLKLGRSSVETIRLLAGCPGDPVEKPKGSIDEPKGRVPAGMYWLSAASTNGIDSRHVGPIDGQQIIGLVVGVWHTKRGEEGASVGLWRRKPGV